MSDVFVAHVVQDIVHVGLQCADVVAFGIGHTSTRTAAVHVVELELHRVALHVDHEEDQLITWKNGLRFSESSLSICFSKCLKLSSTVLSTLHAHLQGVGAVAIGIEHTRIISTSMHVLELEHFHVVIYVGRVKGNSPCATVTFFLRTSAVISSEAPL